MKSDDLLDAIGEVSDEYVADAENVKKRRMPRWARWSCTAAACLAAVAGIGGVLLIRGGIMVALPEARVMRVAAASCTMQVRYFR